MENGIYRHINCAFDRGRGLKNSVNGLILARDGAPSEAWLTYNDAGSTRIKLNCTYYSNPQDGLIYACLEAEPLEFPYNEKVKISESNGTYKATIVNFGRGKTSTIPCERKGFSTSDVQVFLACKGSSQNGESDSFYALDVRFIPGGETNSASGFGRLMYSGSGGALPVGVHCNGDGKGQNFLSCSAEGW